MKTPRCISCERSKVELPETVLLYFVMGDTYECAACREGSRVSVPTHGESCVCCDQPAVITRWGSSYLTNDQDEATDYCAAHDAG